MLINIRSKEIPIILSTQNKIEKQGINYMEIINYNHTSRTACSNFLYLLSHI